MRHRATEGPLGQSAGAPPEEDSMIRAIFVPITDELLRRFPELCHELPVPYHPDLPCMRWAVLPPDDNPRHVPEDQD